MQHLRAIYVEEGCEVDISCDSVPDTAKIVFLSATLPGGVRVQDLSAMKNAVIPEGTKKIGNKWFWGSQLECVTIPASVEEIGTQTFCDCKKLRQVVFKGAGTGNQLRVIGIDAFRGCSGLKAIEFPDGLEEIGISAFQETGLESIRMPRSVKAICQGAFCKCKNLRKAVLNEGLEVLGGNDGCCDGAFGSSALDSIELPSTLRTIECRTFWFCENLRSVQLPDGLEKIGAWCFESSGITEIVLPKSMQEIDEYAFGECKGLKTVILNDGLEKLGECVFSGSAIASVKLSSALKRIEGWMFKECKHLRSVEIPAHTEYIGKSCFSGSGIEKIVLPSTVREIGSWAFSSCSELHEITFEPGSQLERIELGCF